MMLTRIKTLALSGIGARTLDVAVDVSNGRRFELADVPDARRASEVFERARSAIAASGWSLPPRAITASVEPLHETAFEAHADLPIALALLASLGRLSARALEGRIFCGALGLDGAVEPVRGALALAEQAGNLGARQILLPAANAAVAAAADVEVIPVRSLAQAVGYLADEVPIAPAALPPLTASAPSPDFSEVRGLEAAKRALEVAAAGGHNVLLIGPPGSGKTMLARRLPGILPPLTRPEATEVTKIHSLANAELSGLVNERPFRSPHPALSLAALVGSGKNHHPGEASFAHAGVLFLDELPEFRRNVLDALRQPLEEGEVLLARRQGRVRLPARFLLVAAMSGCPCGRFGDPRQECRCPLPLIERFRSRIAGPILDRIDIHLELQPPTPLDLRDPSSEPSAARAARVLEARRIRSRRFPDVKANADLRPDDLDQHCPLAPDARRLLEQASKRLRLAPDARHRILRVARTIADLDASEVLRAPHVGEAIQYRLPIRRG